MQYNSLVSFNLVFITRFVCFEIQYGLIQLRIDIYILDTLKNIHLSLVVLNSNESSKP